MGLIAETAAVFEFLRDVYACLPNAIKLLILFTFGGLIYMSFLRSLWR